MKSKRIIKQEAARMRLKKVYKSFFDYFNKRLPEIISDDYKTSGSNNLNASQCRLLLKMHEPINGPLPKNFEDLNDEEILKLARSVPYL